MKHKHHIIPKYLGGTDDPENIVELTIEEHAEAHKILYEMYGRWEDYIAWLGLSKLISREEVIKTVCSEAGKKTWEIYKEEKIKILRENGKYGHLGGMPKNKYNWITDGKENKFVLSEKEIPKGWRKGLTKKKK